MKYFKEIDQCDEFYLEYFFSILRFYDEVPAIYMHSKHYTDFWDKHTEKVFSDELHFRLEVNQMERDCRYFENVYSKHQLISLFGVIAMRIYFNLSKKYIFVTQFKQKERFYKFFVSESRNIFTVVCDNIALILLKKF